MRSLRDYNAIAMRLQTSCNTVAERQETNTDIVEYKAMGRLQSDKKRSQRDKKRYQSDRKKISKRSQIDGKSIAKRLQSDNKS
jgi:hypothetical protein